MSRNIKKAIIEGGALTEKRPGLDLTVSELQLFYDTFNTTAAEKGTQEALFNLIGDVYNAGLAIGHRNA